MMRRYLGTMLLGSVLTMPVILRADDEHHEAHRAQRYYDRDAKDWHEWNDRENRAYRHYMEERREQYRDFGRLNRERQRNYWRWRHEHPDAVIFPDVR